MNLCPIEGTEIKVARTALAKHKADFALIFYTIEETKSMDTVQVKQMKQMKQVKQVKQTASRVSRNRKL
jgi:hypothetical protein